MLDLHRGTVGRSSNNRGLVLYKSERQSCCANFNGIRLRGAHLDEAILKDADFRCANLSGAFMKEVDVDKTDFDGADLSNLKNTNEARMAVAWNRGGTHCAH